MAGETTRGPCVLYEGTTNGGGYGILPQPVHGSRLAHRAALAEKLGRPVEGHALHHCDTPACVAPRHLYEGSPQDNADDAVARGRARGGRWDQEECKWGHALTPDNVQYATRKGTRPDRPTTTMRRCLECRRRQHREQAARRKAARNLRRMA
jgi:hypothetical protein